MTVTNMERVVLLREVVEVHEARVALAAKELRELQRLLVEKRQQLADLEATTPRKAVLA
jgi:hypothetical protein